MNGRPRALAYALAALALVAVIGLGLRMAAQVGDLKAARSDLADATGKVAELRRTVAAGAGPPLFDARLGAPADQLAQRLRTLGFTAPVAQLQAAAPAGRGLVAARFTAEGQADVVALDRLALWTQANPRSAILDKLSAAATADGKSAVKLELDALVREPGGRPS